MISGIVSRTLLLAESNPIKEPKKPIYSNSLRISVQFLGIQTD
jgi:hypothetical protein